MPPELGFLHGQHHATGVMFASAIPLRVRFAGMRKIPGFGEAEAASAEARIAPYRSLSVIVAVLFPPPLLARWGTLR